MEIGKTLGLTISISLILGFTQGCVPYSATYPSASQKSQLLNSTNVMSIHDPNPPAAPLLPQPVELPKPMTTVPVAFACGPETNSPNPPGVDSIAEIYATYSQNGAVVCADTTNNLHNELLNTKTFTLPKPACSLKPGIYELEITGTYNGYVMSLILNGTSLGTGLAKSKTSVTVTDTAVTVGLAAVTYLDLTLDAGKLWLMGSRVCDKHSQIQVGSPLMIKTNANAGPIELSSQEDGIWFDLLGARRSHAKQRISWTTTDDYKFLVKPNAQGEVRGIDEMFGNNTTGPDGEFADNGYLALAKFDSNHDGRITRGDAEFANLRLWFDKNGDGVGQPEEMVTLNEAGISTIELSFDNSYLEQDQYGNEIRMKSVAQKIDGSLLLVFDLWFRFF